MRQITFIFLLILIPFIAFTQENQIDDLGRKQGKWIKFYQNGIIRYEGQFIDDRPYGEFRYFYESGKLQAVAKHSEDGVISTVNTFHENGNPMAEGTYVNQKKDGTWSYYSDIDGKKVAEEFYVMDKLNGRNIAFYPESGQPAEVYYYRNGLKEGSFQKYYTDGSVMISGKYKNDMPDGEYIIYHENGKINVRGMYKNGLQSGNWEYFDENGKTISEEEFLKQQDPVEKIPENDSK